MSDVNLSSLCDHDFVNALREKHPSNRNKCLDLLAYGQDILYAWNSVEKCVHAVNIKHTIRDSDFKTQVIFSPIQSVCFSVDRISLNLSSSLLAVTGSSGIAVLELPSRWSADNNLKVSCRHLGQVLFLGEQQTLRQAKWHPGSPSDSHLLILTSDECLRLYNASSGEMLWKCLLTPQLINTKTHTNIPSKVSLGDTPVDFDIAPPPFQEEVSSLKWPVLVLWGNGDIYSVTTFIEETRDRIPVQGPLRMYPCSDDNYGSDASSIIILSTSPPIVVFSTCTGNIYNCLLLTSEDSQNENEKSLYAIECIELELGIPVGNDDDIVSCPVRLMKNPIEKSMYFSIHQAGIHSITLPLVSKLYEFLENNEHDFGPYATESYVEYLLCTGVSRGGNEGLITLPLMGCAFIDDLSCLLILLNSGNLIHSSISPHIIYSLQHLEITSKQEKNEDGFLLDIQNLLKNCGPGPVMQLPEAKPQEWHEIIRKVTNSYRAVMGTHENVAKKLEARGQSLRAALLQQQKEVERLTNHKKQLQDIAEQIAERYEEINERQSGLVSRMESMLYHMQYLEPKLSGDENRALTHLESVQRRLGGYERDIARIRTLHEYQASQLDDRVDRMTRRGLYVDDNRGRLMRRQLQNLTTEIASLMRKVKCIEESLPGLWYLPEYA